VPHFKAGNKSPRNKPWEARKYVNRKAISLGHYTTRKEAEEVERANGNQGK
jgi:hypothetical protein